ncbi:di-heme-cytochrome C peroxidase [Spartinivicinus poritis]|uniref:Di-heme-cytochrome C peroxidase n=1 Tax=Spartinivicinus poritis TaxID=2994640 RepID=A0ABT5U2W9_9GAMM|nr:di-heme-cytochrome C peroxidase [Spartinivicinus sp. A2-2]MDE1460720.1 di-heme-cytochrome C peroxidase [Spartinivicinus sp. A2-2]
MLIRHLLLPLGRFIKGKLHLASKMIVVVAVTMVVALIIGKTYQHWDDDPERGAVAVGNGAFGENYTTPTYLEQGWSEADSLWFYNTTQGSGLLPYDFFLKLEQVDSPALFRDTSNIDKFRYLPQKSTFFNPDGLPVGFVKDTYQGHDYMGFTCAACHTGQVNYQGKAIRIDGGPAMADMVGFLTALQKAMEATLDDPNKFERFASNVIDLNNNYTNRQQVKQDLHRWNDNIQLYNVLNYSHVKYGYARLDAFGRIYNRVLQHVQNKSQVRDVLTLLKRPSHRQFLTKEEIDKVLDGINETIIDDEQFATIIRRLASKEPGYPALSFRDLLRVRNALFNEPNAPVSYPFLWDIPQSDFVQWNGLASNVGLGPLGRNAGEVIGVFGILDWQEKEPSFSLAAWLSGQSNKKKQVEFNSSIDLTNLKRLENQLRSLQSPKWPEPIFGKLDPQKVEKGRLIYAQYCQSCHEIIDRAAWDRLMVAKMSSIDLVGTDIAMASNSVNYVGNAGNFKHIYQGTDVGDVIVAQTAPVVQILTAVTTGVVATPDPDKIFLRRWLDWLYTLGMSFFDNTIKASVKAGNYQPDTTAKPYQSLLSYKARSLNGIWATAPYLHNGSVPSLYDLLLPKKQQGDPEDGKYRPDTFMVGSREFDPKKVGFKYTGYPGTEFKTFIAGNNNSGHEYAAGRTPQMDGTELPPLTEEQRWQLVEYLKSL